jgi:hypothetical protein
MHALCQTKTSKKQKARRRTCMLAMEFGIGRIAAFYFSVSLTRGASDAEASLTMTTYDDVLPFSSPNSLDYQSNTANKQQPWRQVN